jgi:hypothetical protein
MIKRYPKKLLAKIDKIIIESPDISFSDFKKKIPEYSEYNFYGRKSWLKQKNLISPTKRYSRNSKKIISLITDFSENDIKGISSFDAMAKIIEAINASSIDEYEIIKIEKKVNNNLVKIIELRKIN